MDSSTEVLLCNVLEMLTHMCDDVAYIREQLQKAVEKEAEDAS